MKNRLFFLLKLVVCWLLYFIFFRLLFLLYHFGRSKELPASEWLGIFVHGFQMDISLAGYIVLVTAVLMATILMLGARAIQRFFLVFNAILAAIFTTIYVVDLELYSHWGYRIDATPLFYLQNPGEAAASVPIWLQLLLIGLIGVLTVAFVWFYRVFPSRQLAATPKGKWWHAPILLFVAGASIVPIRGGFDKATMNAGTVYFSANMYSNHAALNGVWNFLYGVVNKGKLVRVYPEYLPVAEAQGIADSLLAQPKEPISVLKVKRPNVVILLLESFTSKLVGQLGGMHDVAPNFDSLTNEGLLFTNIFAAGDRSDKGFVATLAGFPAQSTQSVIKYPIKTAKLPTISQVFDSLGYSTAFYYGGNADFTNMRSFLYASKIQRIVSQDDFPRGLKRSPWGFHDEHVYQRLLAEMDTASGPFFKLLFTLSCHEPFEVPMETKFAGSGTEAKFLNAAHYADHWLGWFMRQVASRPFYRNTLFILLADHGHSLPGNNQIYEPERFAIPMLWVGGALETKARVETIGSQFDLAKTLLHQMGLSADGFTLSRDLLSPSAQSFAYYVFNDGFGFVEPNSIFIWDHVGGFPIADAALDSTRVRGLAFFQKCHRRFAGL